MDKRRALCIRIIQYAKSIKTNPQIMPRNVFVWNIAEQTAVLGYAKALADDPNIDPKELLISCRLRFINHINSVGTRNAELYFHGDMGLKRMAYKLGIDREDSVSQYYESRKRRRNG